MPRRRIRIAEVTAFGAFPEDPAGPPEYSDEAVALRFAAENSDRLRYVAAWGQWYEFDGTRWRHETTLHAMDLARHVCRRVSSEAKIARKGRIALELASARTVAAVERLARADRRIAATTGQWDRDPWLLNMPTGTIDLRIGERRDHRLADYITRSTAVGALESSRCPLWERFLETVTGKDRQLCDFLKRMVGYALTGITDEHAMFFLYGKGANGKSVFVNTIAGVLGDYARAAPMETFTASHNDRHPTELAALRGARLVTAVETEEGRRWAESRIKMLTGGDTVAARFMRGDFFEFTPQFKLVVAGNHRPTIRGVDEAIRRRMNLVPFAVTIPEDERDEKLAERLREEWPGILRWMLDGCIDWAGEGLVQPKVVQEATAEYIASEDALAQWLADRCDLKAGWWTEVAALYSDWRKWADRAGEFIGSQKRFSQSLEDRGLQKRRSGHVNARGFSGIRLKPPEPDEGTEVP